MLPSNEALQLQQVRDIVAGYELPHFVRGFDVKFDETWDGEPAIHVSFYVQMLHRASREELGRWMCWSKHSGPTFGK